MPPGYHPIKKNASTVPAYSTTRSPGWKAKFAQTQANADRLRNRTVVTGRHAAPRKIGGGDPVFGFLHAAAKAVAPSFTHPIREAKKELHVAKKTYEKLNSAAGWELHQLKMNALPDHYLSDKEFKQKYGRGKRDPVNLRTAKPQILEVTPGGIGRLIQAGQSGFDIAEPIARTLGRVRPSKGVNVVHGPDMGYVGDRGWPTRFPWIVDKKTGEVYVGKLGDSHRDVAARVLNTTDRRVLGDALHPSTGRYHGGFMSAKDEVGNLEMEWGPFSGIEPPANTGPSERLLEMMFGKSHMSPYKDEHFLKLRQNELTQQGDDNWLHELYNEEMLAKQVKRLKAARMKHGYRRH